MFAHINLRFIKVIVIINRFEPKHHIVSVNKKLKTFYSFVIKYKFIIFAVTNKNLKINFMRKMMFNDRFLLTESVLLCMKTQTRRIVTPQPVYDNYTGMNWKGYMSGRGLTDSEEPQYSYRNFVHRSPIKDEEIIAVAQKYSEIPDMCFKHELPSDLFKKGCFNKMFVKSEYMPHKIKITNVRFQRLQDISDDDCMKEGIKQIDDKFGFFDSKKDKYYFYDTPRLAYASLIDKVSGKGTWDNNPYVFVYDFELLT